jgi:hypothetical protein
MKTLMSLVAGLMLASGSLMVADNSFAADSKPAAKPAATKPAATKPAATKPAATKPAATKPAATKPASSKPASKPATKPSSKPASSSSSSSKKPRFSGCGSLMASGQGVLKMQPMMGSKTLRWMRKGESFTLVMDGGMMHYTGGWWLVKAANGYRYWANAANLSCGK